MSSLLKWLNAHVGIRRYFMNTSWMMLDAAVQLLLSLFVGILIARYLGPDQYGIYNYVLSYISIITSISLLGLQHIVIKEVVNKQQQVHILLGTAFVLRFGTAVAALIAVFFLGLLSESDGSVHYFLVIATMPLLLRSFEVIFYYFQARVKSQYYVWAHLAGLFVVAGLRILGIWLEFSLPYFFYIIIADSAVYGGLLLVFYITKGEGSLMRWQFRFNMAKNLVSQSWPLLFSVIIITLYMKIDQVMIGKLLNNASVGYYAAAVKLSTACYGIPWLITGSLFPAILNAKKESVKLYQQRLTYLYQALILLSILIIFPFVVFSDQIINIFFGSDYSKAANVLSIHILASTFVFVGQLRDKWMISDNLQKYMLLCNLPGAVLNIALNFLLIPSFGIEGAAISSFLCHLVSNHLILIVFPSTRHIFRAQTASLVKALMLGVVIDFFKGRIKRI